jgi:hypothetical protein
MRLLNVNRNELGQDDGHLTTASVDGTVLMVTSCEALATVVFPNLQDCRQLPKLSELRYEVSISFQLASSQGSQAPKSASPLGPGSMLLLTPLLLARS